MVLSNRSPKKFPLNTLWNLIVLLIWKWKGVWDKMKARLQIVTPDDQGDYILQKPGKYLFFLFNFSGKLNIEIQNSHIQAFVYGVYIGKGTDRFEVKTIQSHQAGNSISDLHLKGVFFDEAKFLYEGLIKIHKNAQLSN